MKKTIIMIIMALVSISAFGQNFHTTTVRSGGHSTTVSSYSIGSHTYVHISDGGAVSKPQASPFYKENYLSDISTLAGTLNVSVDSIDHMVCDVDYELLHLIYHSLCNGTYLKPKEYEFRYWYASENDFDIFYWAVDYAKKLQNRDWVDPLIVKHNEKPWPVNEYHYNPSEFKKVCEDKGELNSYIQKLIVLKYSNLVNRRQYRKYVKYQKIV